MKLHTMQVATIFFFLISQELVPVRRSFVTSEWYTKMHTCENPLV